MSKTKALPPDRNTLPIVQRLRFRYAKRGRLRFTSHRDFQRAVERAIRRAEVPIAYSAGFSPHPKISYAGAAPTGTASEAEYVELGVTRVLDPDAVRLRLDEALPPGLDVIDMVEARGPGSLADRLEASEWDIELPGVDEAWLLEAVRTLLGTESCEVERMTKNGIRVFDIRPAILRLAAGDSPTADTPEPKSAGQGDGQTTHTSTSGEGCGSCAILHVVVRHGTPAVRPDDVLTGLRMVSGSEQPDAAHWPQMARATRRAQGPWDSESGTVGDPLALDRDAPAA